MTASCKPSALQAGRGSAISDTSLVFGPALPGTGFETLPPLTIPSNLLKFLKSVGLNSIGLGVESVPFHSGWELVVREPSLSGLESGFSEILEICEEVEIEDPIEVFGPQIELNLENPTELGKPPVEVAGVAPTTVVEVEEESSVEVLASVEKKMGDQAEGTGTELVQLEARSGEEPDLMELDQGVRTGGEPVHEAVEEKTGAEPVPEDVAVETKDIPVREVGEGDLHSEDYRGDDFENVGEYSPEEPLQSPSTPAPEHPAVETPSSDEPRRKRFKTLARQTDHPWVRKFIALKAKSSSSSK